MCSDAVDDTDEGGGVLLAARSCVNNVNAAVAASGVRLPVPWPAEDAAVDNIMAACVKAAVAAEEEPLPEEVLGGMAASKDRNVSNGDKEVCTDEFSSEI
jgi:hypothetical protein